MQISPAELTNIVERSSNLSERLSGRFQPAATATAEGRNRLARWTQIGTAKDREFYQKLSALQGAHVLDEALLDGLLGEVRLRSGTNNPEWAELLSAIVVAISEKFAATTGAKRADLYARGVARDVPFGSLFEPVAEVACSRVLCAVSGRGHVVSRVAWRGLQRHLIRRLSRIASRALFTGFLVRKSLSGAAMPENLFEQDTTSRKASCGDGIYSDFVSQQGRDGLLPFFLRYPVAARLMAEITGYWIRFVDEFFERLHADLPDLSVRFNDHRPIGEVMAIKTGISDPHAHGRCVLIITFSSGVRVVYKPRPLAIDIVFYDLVRALNARGFKPSLGSLRVLDRGEYGWVEFATHAACRNDAAVRRFYHRGGSLACLVAWLRGTDCHRENVIAAGEQPMIIDLELLAQNLSLEERLAATDGSPHWLPNSVMRTGLLPMWQGRFQEPGLFDNSGLGAPVSQRSLIETIRWENVNTDAMKLVFGRRHQRSAAHRPKTATVMFSIKGFERDVVAGYKHMADLLEGSFKALFQPWREAIWTTPRRKIKRPTIVYAKFLQRSLEPGFLVNGIDRSLTLLELPSGAGDLDEWRQEIASLESLDIPYLREIGQTAHFGEASSPPGKDLAAQLLFVKLASVRKLYLKEGVVGQLGRRRA